MKTSSLTLVATSALLSLCLQLPAWADQFATHVPMQAGNAATFYVQVQVGDLDTHAFMVDTGSGYMTINEHTLSALQALDQAHYQHELRGILANGSEMKVPVYRLSHINIGGHCQINNVEAAVFPGNTRQIIGLNVLKQAGPFVFSFQPAELQLSHCRASETLASAAEPRPATAVP